MNEQAIKEQAEKLLSLLGVSAGVEVLQTEESADVVLQTDETGMLIGYHGETLEAFQLILSLLVAKNLDKFIRISVEVGDYKKNRKEYLENLVRDLKERVLNSGQAVEVPNLKSWERRVVHLMLQDDSEVVSESVGEGRDRVLTIRPR